MALRALLLRRKIDSKKEELAALREKDAEYQTREAELESAISEAQNEEDQTAVEGLVNEFNADKTAHEDKKATLEREVGELEGQLAEEEKNQNTEPPAGTTPAEAQRKDEKDMSIRDVYRTGSTRDRLAKIVTRDEVKNWLTNIRDSIRQKRAITNVGLTVPEVMLGLLRENLMDYSKLYKHVDVLPVGGTARQLIMGPVTEAIWIECCDTLNEATMGFNDIEVDCYKVGGYFAVCNANLEDSDLNLASEILTALGKSIGMALDKAILYGRNASTTQKMPQGIIPRLVQTEAPTGYPATARPWADLHTSNIVTITAANSTGVKLFQSIVRASKAMKGKYSRGTKTWIMSEDTYTELVAEALTFNAAGAIASGIDGVMPVVGGVIEVLDFIPANVIIGGYFDLYTLAERGGAKFASSEHVRFIQDQTVYKGVARYDGAPAIAEAFVAIGINGTTPTAAMTFPTDTANS